MGVVKCYVFLDEFLACYGGQIQGKLIWGCLKTEEMFPIDITVSLFYLKILNSELFRLDSG